MHLGYLAIHMSSWADGFLRYRFPLSARALEEGSGSPAL